MTTKHTIEQETHLKDLIMRIARHQGRESDSKFCARYRRFVGTPKTWRSRLLAHDFAQLDVPVRINLLNELLGALEGGTIGEDFYDDLPFYKAFRKGINALESQTATDRRIFCVLGAVGVGKTASCKAALRECLEPDWTGPKRVLIIIPEALRESKVGLLSTIADKLGCTPSQAGAAAMMNAIVKFLSGPEITLIIDEAHQGGVMLMRIIKDLVNLTTARFVYVALRTEYARVVSASSGAIMEAKQFIRRCVHPVFERYSEGTVDSITVHRNGKDETHSGDAALLISHRTNLEPSDARRVANQALTKLRCIGNLSTLSDAIEQCLTRLEESDKEISPDALLQTINEICS